MVFPHLKKTILFVLAALLLLCDPASAFAAEPDDVLEKGLTPACSTTLDKASYEDASQYENTPAEVEIVKIGLQYGDNAVTYAEFYNQGGGGFSIGRYDDDRLFHARSHTDAVWLEAYRTEDRLVLGGWGFYEEFDPAEEIALLPDNGGPVIFRGNSYLGGFRITPWDESAMIITNYVALEDYVKGVIPYEMSSSWPFEALRAQAVCARTYVVYNQNKYEEFDFDLTGDTESQVYRGVTYATDLTDRAVDSTKGQFVRYRGEICEIYYFASDGGKTEDGKNVFGSERPYLAGKTDPFEEAVDYTGKSWTIYRDGWDLMNRLQLNEVEIGVVTDFVPKYSELGNVIAVTYTDESGSSVTLSGRDSYAFVRLSNCRFKVQKEDELFVFSGSGWGHNCGMSQWGAKAMAEVYGYNCDDIIRFYYTGAYVG